MISYVTFYLSPKYILWKIKPSIANFCKYSLMSASWGSYFEQFVFNAVSEQPVAGAASTMMDWDTTIMHPEPTPPQQVSRDIPSTSAEPITFCKLTISVSAR